MPNVIELVNSGQWAGTKPWVKSKSICSSVSQTCLQMDVMDPGMRKSNPKFRLTVALSLYLVINILILRIIGILIRKMPMETTDIYLIFDLICKIGIRSRNKILSKREVRNIVSLVGCLVFRVICTSLYWRTDLTRRESCTSE